MLKLLPFVFYLVFNNADEIKCPIPEGCRIEKIYETRNYYGFEDIRKHSSIACDINTDEFQFQFNEPWPNHTPENCFISKGENLYGNHYMILRWTSSLAILERRFNLTNFHRYPSLFFRQLNLKLVNAKGFDVNIIDDELLLNPINPLVLDLIDCRLDFYHNRHKLQSCQDFIDSNVTEIRSIFHLLSLSVWNAILRYRSFEYKPKTICPLLFVNVSFDSLELFYLENTFYKQSILTISNDTYNRDLNSFIGSISLQQIHNINLDLSLLHPKVFKNLSEITIGEGSLNSIDGQIFVHLKNLLMLIINPIIMRKINHKQGIQWIRQMNYGTHVNLTNLTINDRPMKIILFERLEKPSYQLSKVFPDKDFCIYVHYPFNQFVVLREYYDTELMFSIDHDLNISRTMHYSCTFLWLAQYYVYYYRYFNSKYAGDDDGYARIAETGSLIILFKSNDYKSISKCNFDERIRLCNKSNYQIKEIWDRNDFLILSKKLQIAVKVLIYLISLFGLFTNFIAAIVILKKENSDLFKGFKQYSYLYLNSIFCMIILVIEILSWMSECFYPFEVFCPEIRKLVVIQFFKIIFKECLVTMLRFMCNFTYVAFALNRISLIGREHGKLVTFMSDLGMKKYIGVTLLTSAIFSWIKGFRYQVNYSYPHLNFPISLNRVVES